MNPIADVPPLPGWMSTIEAADRLMVTKQMVHKLMDQQRFTTLHRVGPVYVISCAEVEVMALERSRQQRRRRWPMGGAD